MPSPNDNRAGLFKKHVFKEFFHPFEPGGVSHIASRVKGYGDLEQFAFEEYLPPTERFIDYAPRIEGLLGKVTRDLEYEHLLKNLKMNDITPLMNRDKVFSKHDFDERMRLLDHISFTLQGCMLQIESHLHREDPSTAYHDAIQVGKHIQKLSDLSDKLKEDLSMKGKLYNYTSPKEKALIEERNLFLDCFYKLAEQLGLKGEVVPTDLQKMDQEEVHALIREKGWFRNATQKPDPVKGEDFELEPNPVNTEEKKSNA